MPSMLKCGAEVLHAFVMHQNCLFSVTEGEFCSKQGIDCKLQKGSMNELKVWDPDEL